MTTDLVFAVLIRIYLFEESLPPGLCSVPISFSSSPSSSSTPSTILLITFYSDYKQTTWEQFTILLPYITLHIYIIDKHGRR